MATYYARKAGNINAADVWATTPSGTAAPVTFASGDVLVANSFTVTVNVSVDLGSTGQVRNDTSGGATNGGGFILKANQTLTASVITGAIASCLTFSDAGSTYVVGTINANATNVSTSGLVNNSSTGTVFVTGNVVGSSAGANATGITNSAGGVINVTGSVLGASGTAMRNSAGGTIIVTGPVEAGLGASGFGHGILNAAAGTIQVVGNVTASSNLPAISSTNASSVVRVSGSFIHAVNGQVPIASNRVLLNTTPTLAFTRYAVNGTGTYFDMFTADNTGLGPATGNVRAGVSYGGMTGSLAVPLPSQVAVGVATDDTVGTAAITADNLRAALGLGSANLDTQLAVLSNLDAAVSSRLAPSGTLATVTTLTNAPASVTPSDIWSHAARTLTSASGPSATDIRQEMDSNSTKLANLDTTVSSRLATSGYTAPPTPPTAAANATAVRTELSTELARVDAAVSTRLAGSAYTAPSNSDVTAIKAKTDLLETTRLAQCSTVATTGAQLAAALS